MRSIPIPIGHKSRLSGRTAQLSCIFVLVSILLVGGSEALCATGSAPQTPALTSDQSRPQKKSLAELLQTPFAYRRENRSDPFKPFLTPETGPSLLAPEAEAPLTGMQLFEPGQLTLVTILFSGKQALAMVEDSTGMGHIIRVHDKIGRRGEVKSIEPNTVIIEEWSLSISGTKRITTSEMVLRKEGELE